MLTITNEDNMELMARYPDKHFELAIVDPPYGIDENMRSGSRPINKMYQEKEIWDIVPKPEYFSELFRVSKNQIIWGGNYFPLPPSRCWIIWDKQQPVKTFADGEMAWTNFDEVVSFFRFSFSANKNKIHPTQKPVALYKWVLRNYAKPNDKILDTHLGSGSIAIACHDLGFDLTACELDKEYFDKAMDRITKHTAQQFLGLEKC
jgi:site-specific DNA-methyltransferase (adenine-specific)